MSLKQRSTFLNYITDETFRKSLEADYQETEAALQSKSWKTVHVMSGSLIETILIDYLLTKAKSESERTKVLKMDLGEAVDECERDGVLSAENAKLCSVLRSYRNLIHPGRSKRLEKAPTENASVVASKVVLMVAEDVARKRKETYGYTAEQVIEKLMSDPEGFIGILGSLLEKVNDAEKERLLFDCLPSKNHSIRQSMEFGMQNEEYSDAGRQLFCIKQCFRVITRTSNQMTLERLVSTYVKTLESSAFDSRKYYEQAFLDAFHFKNAINSDREIIKVHVLATLTRGVSQEFLDSSYHLGEWIDATEIPRLVHIVSLIHEQYPDKILDWLTHCHFAMNQDVADKLKKYLEDSIRNKYFSAKKIEMMKELLNACNGIPF